MKLNYKTRIRAAHTVACFMVGAPTCPVQKIQRLTVALNTPVSNMLERIYKKQRGLIETPVTYDTVARN